MVARLFLLLLCSSVVSQRAFAQKYSSYAYYMHCGRTTGSIPMILGSQYHIHQCDFSYLDIRTNEGPWYGTPLAMGEALHVGLIAPWYMCAESAIEAQLYQGDKLVANLIHDQAHAPFYQPAYRTDLTPLLFTFVAQAGAYTEGQYRLSVTFHSTCTHQKNGWARFDLPVQLCQHKKAPPINLNCRTSCGSSFDLTYCSPEDLPYMRVHQHTMGSLSRWSFSGAITSTTLPSEMVWQAGELQIYEINDWGQIMGKVSDTIVIDYQTPTQRQAHYQLMVQLPLLYYNDRNLLIVWQSADHQNKLELLLKSSL